MIVIIFVAILRFVALHLGQKVRKNSVIIYTLVTLISILAFVMQDNKITEPIMQGYLGLSFLYVVMITGIVKKKTKLSIKLMAVRKEYSIIGFIFITPHGLKYLLEMIEGARDFEWFGIAAYVIMIPLFITSFMIVRKKFTFKVWKKIQRFAYIVYILMFIHLILLSAMPNLLVYIILFVPYIIFKPIKELNMYKEKKQSKKIELEKVLT